MSIPTIEYRGYALSAYPRQEFPLHRDPYAKGPRQFSCIVRIDPIPAAGVKAGRYSTLFGTASPTNEDDAVDLAMQYGKDIIDGKVQATEL
ncbi:MULTISPECIES: hypothetical protein [Burkholderiaceae]|uniref:Uncharacterized protein n=1 Tax=Burkholderia ubonensis subsp. mesacidophila TaxID=265293 RepID=A0A2A4FC84_9BURK|nr:MULTISPECIES: hypothetical protein [Burkholderiaceae]PCE30238.1 hypothetical protein BZL54_21345 [Burkholderia ubonensis subsp. mesacidophila]